MRRDLTDRQRQVLELIRRWGAEKGAPPTIRELRQPLRLKSLRGVTIHLDALVRKGYIRRSRQARGIRVIGDLPAPMQEKRKKPMMAPIYEIQTKTVLLPVVGRIAAGQPILAEQHIEERLAVDPRWIPGPGCFAVRVHGESMVNAGIHHSDYVVVRPQETAENGQIVAVLIDGEATVKKFYQERGGRIRLQPENPAMEPMFLNPRDKSVQIIGRVVGLFRKF